MGIEDVETQGRIAAISIRQLLPREHLIHINDTTPARSKRGTLVANPL